MEILLAFWIIWRFFKVFTDAFNSLPDRLDGDGNAIYLVDGREVYKDGTAADTPRPQPEPKGKQKKTKTGKRYTITEGKIDEATMYTLDGGSLEDDEELIYPDD